MKPAFIPRLRFFPQRNDVGPILPFRTATNGEIFRYDIKRQEKITLVVTSFAFGSVGVQGTAADDKRHG